MDFFEDYEAPVVDLPPVPPSASFGYSVRETARAQDLTQPDHFWDGTLMLGTSFGLVVGFNCDQIEPDYLLLSPCCMAVLAGLPPRLTCVQCHGTSPYPFGQRVSSRSYIHETDSAMLEDWISSLTDPLRAPLYAHELGDLLTWLQALGSSISEQRLTRRELHRVLCRYFDTDRYLQASAAAVAQ